jgi:hypothetical protein
LRERGKQAKNFLSLSTTPKGKLRERGKQNFKTFPQTFMFSNVMRKFLRSAIIEKINRLDCTAHDVKNALLLAQPAPHDDAEICALNAELLQAIRNYYSAQTVEKNDFANN